MKFIIDMVHHNPGEKPFETRFTSGESLREYGYRGQVFKHINTIITFSKLGHELFPEGTEEGKWMGDFTRLIRGEIAQAKNAGLEVYYHVDLFVLPKKLAEIYRDEICDPGTGRISMDREKTLELHRVMLDELFERFPEVDGLIIRVGETYLFDTPYHTGNGPIPLEGEYAHPASEKRKYVKLLNFLREEVCVRHGRYLIFRTWDCLPDKFHASPEFYLAVTGEVEPHEKLVFSIKHTALDFWRRVKFNQCLTAGKHPQVVEVQCQREYEGKGAYPNYVMNGVIHGFEENADKKGLDEITGHPLIRGIYTWSRGGGWGGPYIKNEFWCKLNTYVISRFANDPDAREEEIFYRFTREKMGLDRKDSEIFRKLCLLSATAVLKGRYCQAYDTTLLEGIMPTGNWMRDDCLGGLSQLGEVFDYLFENDLLDSALAEKRQSVELWKEIESLFDQLHIPDPDLKEAVGVSVRYGVLLFGIIERGWTIMDEGIRGDRTGIYDKKAIEEAFFRYDQLWREYLALGKQEQCASLYREDYQFGKPGLRYSLRKYRQIAGA